MSSATLKSKEGERPFGKMSASTRAANSWCKSHWHLNPSHLFFFFFFVFVLQEASFPLCPNQPTNRPTFLPSCQRNEFVLTHVVTRSAERASTAQPGGKETQAGDKKKKKREKFTLVLPLPATRDRRLRETFKFSGTTWHQIHVFFCLFFFCLFLTDSVWWVCWDFRVSSDLLFIFTTRTPKIYIFLGGLKILNVRRWEKRTEIEGLGKVNGLFTGRFMRRDNLFLSLFFFFHFLMFSSSLDTDRQTEGEVFILLYFSLCWWQCDTFELIFWKEIDFLFRPVTFHSSFTHLLWETREAREGRIWFPLTDYWFSMTLR